MTGAADIDQVIDHAIEDEGIVGAVVLVAHDGQVVYERAAGVADRETGTPMTRDTVCRLASVTKPITAVAAMSLVDSGELDLTTPINHWLPGFRPALSSRERLDITVDHLLLHTSGLAYRMNEPADSDYSRLDVSDGMDRTDLSLAENIDRIGRTTLRFAPGSDWLYSVSYDVLGGVIEAATGAPLQQVVADRVTGPLGMTSTTFAVDEGQPVATAYVTSVEGTVPIRDEVPVPTVAGYESWMSPSRIFDKHQFPSGGAGMAGSAADVLTLLEAVRTADDRILRSDTVADMYVARAEHETSPGVFGAHARGWAVTQPSEEAALGLRPGTLHWGSAYGHSWSISLERKSSVVYFTNTRAHEPLQLASCDRSVLPHCSSKSLDLLVERLAGVVRCRAGDTRWRQWPTARARPVASPARRRRAPLIAPCGDPLPTHAHGRLHPGHSPIAVPDPLEATECLNGLGAIHDRRQWGACLTVATAGRSE